MDAREQQAADGQPGAWDPPGTALRRARLEADRSIADVAASAAVSPADLAALERGDLRRVTDPVRAMSLVRQLARALGLDPEEAAADVLGEPEARDTGIPDDPGGQSDPAPEFGAGDGAAATDHLDALADAPTTQTPAVSGPPRQPSPGARRRGAPSSPAPPRLTWAVRLVAVALGIALVALALLAAPRVLALFSRLHGAAGTSGGQQATATTAPGLLTQETGGRGGAVYQVHARRFTVAISTRGPCWVQVTRAASGPVLSRRLPAGSYRTVTSRGPMTIRVGASDVSLLVEAGNYRPAGLSPPSAPYDFTLTPG